jgi:hypothetical protein
MGAERWWCLFTVSHVSLGDQATSQKDGRQKKTHFHIVFEFDFDFGLELEFDKLASPLPSAGDQGGLFVWFLLQF